jgi:hypothetical protein
MEKMYTSGVLSTDNPEGLQKKVYVELSMHFGRRGREGLRQLRKDSIVIKTDDKGREYATLSYNEIDKNHQVQLPKEQEKRQIMFAQPASENCPVKSLKKYLAKLNPRCDAFFQRPKPKFTQDEGEVWYENKNLGVHKLETLMKTISKEAQLSELYTNHCLRATTSTILSHAGFESRNICSVTGHKNESSLKSYIKEPSLEQRAQMSDILHCYGKDNIKDGTALLCKPTSTVTRASATSTMSTVPQGSEITVENNTSKMSIDTSSAVFAGATFTGPTSINVMINKN